MPARAIIGSRAEYLGLILALAMLVTLVASLFAPQASAAPAEVDTVCVAAATGAVRIARNCTPAEYQLYVEAGTTVGVDRYTGKVKYLARGNYPPTFYTVTTDGGPSEGGQGIEFCVYKPNGELRHYPNGCPNSPSLTPVLI